MNTFALLILLLAVAVVGNEDYSNAANLESVTTFFSCEEAPNASIPDDLKARVCDGVGSGPITVARFLVRPGENDVDAGRSMAFFTYPQPSEVQPINQQTPPPPGVPDDDACKNANAGTNCSVFTDGSADPTQDQTGPITVQVISSNAVRKYLLKPVIEGLAAPYAYLNHDATIPRCPGKFCKNGCATGRNLGGCDPTTSGPDSKTKTSFYACCQFQDDYEPHGCSKKDSGDVFNQFNALYDWSDSECGEYDEEMVLAKSQSSDIYGKSFDEDLTNCRSCSKLYGMKGKSTSIIFSPCQFVDKCANKDSGKSANSLDGGWTQYSQPTTIHDLCPLGVTHNEAYPVTEGDRNSYAHGNPDAYTTEPYYYWCQSLCVGTTSYTPKRVNDLGMVGNIAETNYTGLDLQCQRPGKDDGCGAFPPAGQNVTSFATGEFVDGIVRIDQQGTAGLYVDAYSAWSNAYSCSIDIESTCPMLDFAKAMDSAGFPCCNSSFLPPDAMAGGQFAETCGVDNTFEGFCGNMAQEQVRNAVSYLTANCNAEDSQETICGHDCKGNKDRSWQCPGWQYDHLRPSTKLNPTTTTDGEQGLAVAKCSGECQADPFIRWSETSGDNNCLFDDCDVSLQAATKQKAAIPLARADCKVYQVVPEPIVDMQLEIIYTAPSGNVTISRLSTEGIDPVIDTVQLDGVDFTTRINQMFVRGGAGPQIPGYIVICGTEEQANKPADCIPTNPNDNSYPQYNPYDPEVGGPVFEDDDDISVQAPWKTSGDPGFVETEFCQSKNNFGLGQIRGVFPQKDENGIEFSVPNQNPWPQLIRKMVQSRSLNGMTTDTLDPDNDLVHQEATVCHAPTERYLGVLNCGRPVYWYYVSQERKTSYGGGCGRNGFQNSFAMSPSGRRIMCEQGDNSCTPGYGLPKFTESNAPFFRSPCQELGDMIKKTSNVRDESGNPLGCDGSPPVGLQIPGFQYIPGTYNGESVGSSSHTVAGVPNTWIHGDSQVGIFLYQDFSTSQQQNIELDMSMYTDTFFGGNVQTFSDGEIVPLPGNTTICTATLNGGSDGTLAIGVKNTNSESGGSYTLTVECEDSASDTDLIATPGTVADIDVGPLDTVFETFTITASGSQIPNTSDTDMDVDSDGSIGYPVCKIKLFHAGGDNAELDEKNISCSLIGFTVLKNGRVTVIDDVLQFTNTCADWWWLSRPFCWLSNEGPYETFMIWFLFIVLSLSLCRTSVYLVRGYQVSLKLDENIKEYRRELAAKEESKEERMALIMQRLVSSR